MSEPTTNEQRTSPLPARIAVGAVFVLWCGACAWLMTWRVVSLSAVFGHLARPARPDDVGYMLDGARRLLLVRVEGVGAYFSAYVADAPHAPWQSALATVSFWVLGLRDASPYIATGAVVFVWLVALDWAVFRRLGWWARLGAITLTCSAPLLASAVYTFRPDAAMSVLLASACAVLLLRSMARVSTVRVLLIAGLFAAAFWAKPSTFAQTAIVLCAALGASVVVDVLCERERGWRRVPSLLVRPAMIAAVAALFCLPHLLLRGPDLWSYFWANTFGENASVWVSDLSPLEHALYHVTAAEGGGLHLGRHGLIVLAGIAAGFAAARRDREWAIRYAGFGAVVVLLYLVSATNAVKQQYFGMPFQAALVLMGLLGLARWSNANRNRAAWALPLIAFGGVLLWRAPFPTGEADAVASEHRTAFFEGVYAELEPYSGGAVFVSAPIPALTADLLRYESLKRTRDLDGEWEVFDAIYPDSYQKLSPRIEGAAAVVTLETEAAWRFAHHFPTIDLQAEIAAELHARPDMRLLAEVPFGDGSGGASVFVRGERFGGFSGGSGLAGPGVKGTRVSYSPSGEIILDATPGSGELFAVVRAAREFESLGVFAGDERVGSFELPRWPQWATVRCALPLGTGAVVLRLEPEPDPGAERRAVAEFSALHFVEPGQ